MHIQELAISVLNASSPTDKVAAAHYMVSEWHAHDMAVSIRSELFIPDTPGRPMRPKLVEPSEVKRRRLGSLEGRVSLLHAIAHIEFNAINLAADMLARYGDSSRISNQCRKNFICDWVKVCGDEARHFTMVDERLSELGSHYGDLPAHNGLWQAAQTTSQDILARLVVAPMILEARGLDVTPGMIKKLVSVNDKASAEILKIIYDEEIPHVAAGTRWFKHICARENRDAVDTFKILLKTHYKGTLKPPFNSEARTLAGMPNEFYQP